MVGWAYVAMAVQCASRMPGDLPSNAPSARGEVRGCVGRMRLADTDAGTQTPTATPERVAVFTIHYAHGAAPRGAYTIRALEGQLALLPTAEPPAMRRSVTADISVASSPERSCSASLHAPPLLGSTGP